MEAPCSTRNGINIKILPMFVFSSIKKLNILIFFIYISNKKTRITKLKKCFYHKKKWFLKKTKLYDNL